MGGEGNLGYREPGDCVRGRLGVTDEEEETHVFDSIPVV